MENQTRTFCAQLTPAGRGAVAVVGLHGPRAESVLDEAFRPANGRKFSDCTRQKIVYGVWRSTKEDLVVSRRNSDWFEVHCHGGHTACQAILASLAESLVDVLPSAEFSLVFDNAWIVSTQIALTEATTVRSAELLLNQLRILPDAIAEISSLIKSNQRELAQAQIEQMLAWSEFGIHLTEPRSIVLCGQPNVGKSSLVNAIIGFQRAIVHNVPGTTRDVVSQLTAINGWPVELNDTAGLRDATGEIEAIGIEKARTLIKKANLKVCIFDLSRPWTDEDRDVLESIQPHLIIHNKADLVDDHSAAPPNSDSRPKGLTTSVETGQGIKQMIGQIGNLLVPLQPDADQAIPVSNAQRKKLQEFAARLRDSESCDPAEIYEFPIETK